MNLDRIEFASSESPSKNSTSPSNANELCTSPGCTLEVMIMAFFPSLCFRWALKICWYCLELS